MDFFELHRQPALLLLANVWDAASARAAAAAGYPAMGTSSAAIAAMLGRKDGEDVTFPELLHCVERIRAASPIPLSVDMEAGHSRDPAQVVAYLVRLSALGVMGVNLEDSRVQAGARILQEAADFALWLQAVRSGLQRAGIRMFLNVRTDGFLLGHENAREETFARGLRYAANGADGLFVPGVTDATDIEAIATAVPLPLNVMCMPGLPAFGTLAALGVKRISMGDFVFAAVNRQLHGILGDILCQQSFRSLFADAHH